MRFTNYINEENTDNSNLIPFIVDNCKPYLDISTSRGKEPLWLYSGRKKKVDSFIGEVHKQREPRDTSKDMHILFDKLFYEVYGIKPRSQSLFCTGSLIVAGTYGTPYTIFPIGKFRYIWNPNFPDLYHRTRSVLIQKSGIRTKEVLTKEVFQNYIPDIKKLIESYSFNKNWDKAVKSNSEVMILCDKYLAVSLELSSGIREYFKTEY
jgi:hypothetical protein